jgi:hypothetical protein
MRETASMREQKGFHQIAASPAASSSADRLLLAAFSPVSMKIGRRARVAAAASGERICRQSSGALATP